MLKTHQIIQTLRNGCLLAATAWLLTGCGAGSTGDTAATLQTATAISDSAENGTTQTVVVSGQAVKGTLIGARVSLYPIRNVAGQAVPDTRKALAETTTDQTGHFTFTLNTAVDTDFLVEVASTDTTEMICDDVDGCTNGKGVVAFGKRMAAPRSLRLEAWRSQGNAQPVSVSTLSHIVVEKARRHQMGLTRETVQAAKSALAAQLAVETEVLDAMVEDVTVTVPRDTRSLKASILNTTLASLSDSQQDMGALVSNLAETFAAKNTLPQRDTILTRIGEVAVKVVESQPDAADASVIDWALAAVNEASSQPTNTETQPTVADNTATTPTTTAGNDNASNVSGSDTGLTTTETAPGGSETTEVVVVDTGTTVEMINPGDTTGSQTTTDNGTGSTTTTDTTTEANTTPNTSDTGTVAETTNLGNNTGSETAAGNGTDTTTTPSEPVIEPVAISLPPASQTAGYGQSVTLNVSATGTGPLTYQWKKNGVAIEGANQATLTLSAVSRADEGQYSVVVSNEAGSVESTAATLTVEVDTTATLTWTIPETREDGSALPLTDIAGYKIYKGTSENNLTEVAYITDATQTIQQFTDLPTGRWYFAVSVVDVNGLESELSNSGYKDIF